MLSELTKREKKLLLIIAIFAAIVPNGYYLYLLTASPELQKSALSNPVSLTFMAETLILLSMFLWYVYKTTKSYKQLLLYS